MNDETTQIPVKKRTRQKLRNISRKGETYDELIKKLVRAREKFKDTRGFRNWFEKNHEILGFEDLKVDPKGGSTDYIASRDDDEIKVSLQTLSSDFVKLGREPSQIDLLICLFEDEELSVETLEITDFDFGSNLSLVSTGKGYREILLLLELARNEVENGSFETSPEELAELMDENPQKVSFWLEDLMKNDLARKDPDTGRYGITTEGNDFLRSVWLDFEKVFGDFSEELMLEGELVSGFGEGEYYVTKEGYRRQFIEKLGFNPYPGTLDLKLNKGSLRAREWLEIEDGILIEGFSTEKRSFGKVKCFKARIGEDEAAIVLPYRTHHEDDILEIISPIKIKDKYDLEKGDELEVEVEI